MYKKFALSTLILVLIFSFTSCSTVGIKKDEVKKKPIVALVLGGGAARGFAHIGVLRVLEQEKIPIDMIIGTSVGSLIGALYAANPNSLDLEWTAFKIEKDDIFDFSLLSVKWGMVKGERIEAFIIKKIGNKNIEQLKIPFAAVATYIYTGEKIVLDKGSVAKAVHASSAIPGVFAPVVHQGKFLVDGGVVENLPVDTARAKGADIIIAVDIGKSVYNPNISSVFDVILQSVNIMGYEINKSKVKNADVLIEPNVGNIGITDFSQKKALIEAGVIAAKKAIPRIKQLMGGN